MGRATKAQAQEHREQLIAAASQLFRQRGVDNVTVPELMATTGMTHGGIYANGCPLASLSGDIARTDPDSPARASFIAGVRAFADGVEALDDDGTPEHRAHSLARLSMLMGALALSRATEGDPISEEFIAAVRAALATDESSTSR